MFNQRYLPYLLGLLLLALAAPAFAQSTPLVSVELSAPTASEGSTVTANVFIRNGVNIAGADVGIETDECLKVLSRVQGEFLPDASVGGFTVFDQTTERSTRLAVAITDRATLASEDGIFFSADLEVTCSDGLANVTVAVAELSAYADPTAELVQLIGYTTASGTLETSDSQLTIVNADAVAAVDEQPEDSQPEPQPESEDETQLAEETSEADEQPVGADESDDSAEILSSPLTIGAVVVAAGVVLLVGIRAVRRP